MSNTSDFKRLNIDRVMGVIQKYLFIGFAIGGAGIVWILGMNHVSQGVAEIFPVSFIAAYCFIALKTKKFFISEEKIGDNAYYLGFLYTLSSLSYALHVFSPEQHNANEFIVSSFGVALWTTIVGIACRVTLLQLRQDPNDIEKEVRVSISDTASILTSELHQAAQSFSTYRKTLQKSMEEAFINLNDKAEVCLTNSTNKISETVNAIVDSIDIRFKDLNDNAIKLNQATDQVTESLDKMSEHIEIESRTRISETACILTTELKNVSQSFDEYRINLQKMMDEAFGNINNKAGECLMASTKQISEASETILTNIDSKFENSKTNINRMNESSENIANALEEVSSRIDKSLASIGSFGVALDSLSTGQIRSVEAVSDTFGVLTANVQALNDKINSMKSISDNLVSGCQSIDAVDTMLKPAIARFTGLLSELTDKQEITLNEITGHADAMREQLKRSREYTEQTHDSLSKMAKTLADKLQ